MRPALIKALFAVVGILTLAGCGGDGGDGGDDDVTATDAAATTTTEPVASCDIQTEFGLLQTEFDESMEKGCAQHDAMMAVCTVEEFDAANLKVCSCDKGTCDKTEANCPADKLAEEPIKYADMNMATTCAGCSVALNMLYQTHADDPTQACSTYVPKLEAECTDAEIIAFEIDYACNCAEVDGECPDDCKVYHQTKASYLEWVGVYVCPGACGTAINNLWGQHGTNQTAACSNVPTIKDECEDADIVARKFGKACNCPDGDNDSCRVDGDCPEEYSEYFTSKTEWVEWVETYLCPA